MERRIRVLVHPHQHHPLLLPRDEIDDFHDCDCDFDFECNSDCDSERCYFGGWDDRRRIGEGCWTMTTFRFRPTRRKRKKGRGRVSRSHLVTRKQRKRKRKRGWHSVLMGWSVVSPIHSSSPPHPHPQSSSCYGWKYRYWRWLEVLWGWVWDARITPLFLPPRRLQYTGIVYREGYMRERGVM